MRFRHRQRPVAQSLFAALDVGQRIRLTATRLRALLAILSPPRLNRRRSVRLDGIEPQVAVARDFR
ncbi:hypothetical protein EAD98_17640 [Micromonospora sp. CV4]|nr:hypothetical protein EAD98_17640 [Micromonospora sp. CV4]